MKSDAPSEWHRLFNAALNDQISDSEHAQLAAVLKSSAEARQLWFLYQDNECSLAELKPRNQAKSPRTGFSWLSWRPLTSAALIICGVTTWLWWSGRGQGENGISVATVLLTEGCEWRDGLVLADGQRVEAGALQLNRGLAVIRFDGGAEMVLQGAASVELSSRGSVKVNRGKITVRVNEMSVGFKVRTPSSDLTDLGTEFEVNVGEHGDTELQVLDGAVSYAPHGVRVENEPQVTAGKALRFAARDMVAPSEIAFDARPFAELINEVQTGPRGDYLLARESFDYEVGMLPLERANGGQGWSGAWQIGRLAGLQANDSGALQIATDRIHGPWPVDGGRRGMLQVDGRFGSRMRWLAKPVRLDRDGIYYLSMMVRWEIPADKLKSKDWRFLRVALRSSADYTGDRVSLTLPGFLRPQVQVSDDFRFMSPAHVRPNESQLWCAKIVARANGEDEVSFHIYGENDSLDFAEPAFWHITSRDERSDAVLDEVVLAAGGIGTAWFDELRIGTSWRDVLPPRLMTY